jgi:UDP-glucuronate 4-epimerase
MLTGKKILLTGIMGRVGGNFGTVLSQHNEVWAIDRFSNDEQRKVWEKLGIKTVVCDFSTGNFDGVPDDCEYVIHVAANIYPASFEEGMRDNAEGAGLLMFHCRKAKAFLHVSTTGVYAHHPDPTHRYTTEDPIGGGTMGHYNGTKAAGEGAVRTVARILNLPTIICRLDVQYGTYADGGLPVNQFRNVINGKPNRLPASYPVMHAPVHEDDLAAFIEPCLKAASVPVTTVNWCGDDALQAEEWVNYMAGLAGVKPIYEYTDENPWPTCIPDNARRLAITGPCKVHWKDGMRRVVEYWEPRIKG